MRSLSAKVSMRRAPNRHSFVVTDGDISSDLDAFTSPRTARANGAANAEPLP